MPLVLYLPFNWFPFFNTQTHFSLIEAFLDLILALEDQGYHVQVVITDFRSQPGGTTSDDIMNFLGNTNRLFLAKKGQDDDSLLIAHAHRRNAAILSNDNFSMFYFCCYSNKFLSIFILRLALMEKWLGSRMLSNIDGTKIKTTTYYSIFLATTSRVVCFIQEE